MRTCLPPATHKILSALFLTLFLPALAVGQDAKPGEQPLDKQMQSKRRPKTYITIFMNGYGGETLPKDPAQFEKILQAAATEGNFNAVMCKYSEEREQLCKKHNMLMVVDLLADQYHVFKEPKGAEALCQKLRDNPTIVAYHLWSDLFGKTGPGRERDINNVHRWDPTHATYIGTYRSHGIGHFAKSDFVSFYDFAWKRGPNSNFGHLLAAYNVAKIHDQRLGRYLEIDAGQPGKGNVNRMLYTQNTSIALGLRGCLWHIASGIMNLETTAFTQAGKDVGAVNAWIKPLREEIAKLGLPYGIYSTSWTMDYNNRPVQAAAGAKPMPPGLDNYKFPADFWIQPVSGEFVMGLSKYAYTDADAAYLANHNAYAEQKVKLKITKPGSVSHFDRETGQWKALEAVDGTVSFKIDAGGGAILRFGK